jgi:TonB family protein
VACVAPAPDAVAAPAAKKPSNEMPAGPHLTTGIHGVSTVDGSSVTPGDSAPKYPTQLRVANIQGSVVARFIIRQNGSVDPKSITIVKSTHDLFAASVRTWLESARFNSNQGGDKSPVTMPFVFSLSP